MSQSPPFRLRLSLAFLLLAVAGVVVGAAVVFGSGQADPAEATADELFITGPPLVPAVPEATPTAFEGSNPGMRLGVLDKDEAIREERRLRREARALRELAEQQAAQEAAIYEFAAALDAARRTPAAPPATTTTRPSTTSAGGGGGGGGGGHQPPPPPVPNHDDDPLYVKLDNIATCESGQNPQAFNPRGPYYGAFQFLRETWDRYGGGPRDIRRYAYNQQREVAARLAQARGFAGSWPTCAARYGYS